MRLGQVANRATRLTIGVLAAVMLALLVVPVAALVLRALSGRGSLPALFSQPLADAVLLSLITTSLSALLIVALACWLRLRPLPFPAEAAQCVDRDAGGDAARRRGAGAADVRAARRARRGAGGAGVSLPFSAAACDRAGVCGVALFHPRGSGGVQSIPASEEAASIDRATGVQTFLHVILPLSARGLLVGLVLSWAQALGEFGATILFAGNLQGAPRRCRCSCTARWSATSTALWASVMLIGVAVMALGVMRWLAGLEGRRAARRAGVEVSLRSTEL